MQEAPGTRMPDATASSPAWLRRSVRSVAGFEALKGVAVVLLVLGLLTAERDGGLHELAVALAGRVRLHPHALWPSLALQGVDHLQEVHAGQIGAVAALYAAMRFTESWGLWHGRRWAAWLAALSTAIYLPFELEHLLHRPGAIAAAVLGVNLAVLGLMVLRLRQPG